MFERFTERARQVVVLAQDEARALKHNYIGTEHLLLGLLREEEGLAARVLESFDVTVEEVRAQVARMVGQGDEVVGGQIPFTPRAKLVLEHALREAIALGHNYIGTEHILLGLERESDGIAARILRDFDAGPTAVRNELLRMLSGPGRPARARPPVNLPYLVAALAQARNQAIGEQNNPRAESLRELERRLARLVDEIQAEVGAGAGDGSRWEYDARTLEGATATWPEQLSAWRCDGWELLAVVEEDGGHRALLERRI